jgi:hypothetical protein
MSRQFICDRCNKEVEIDDNWTEEDAQKEREANFGNIEEEDCARLCTPCYNIIMATMTQ